jgi:Spy/CpxP family protein refolding chaperone
MKTRWKSLLLVALLAAGGPALADQSLKSALGLDVEQARKVDMIESKYRKPYSAKRQERDSELRKLRRARIANDSKAIATQEAITTRLQEELRQIYVAKNAEIRTVLRPDQQPRFEKHLQLAKEMKGSSRDAKDF